MANTAYSKYPKKYEALLKKAGLLMHGKVQLMPLRQERQEMRSEDGEEFERIKRIEGDDSSALLTNSTVPVRDGSGRIAGYWANGLTDEEKNIIHNECGVPFYYLGEPLDKDGRATIPDSRLNIVEGMELDLSDPKDVAFFRILLPVKSMVGASFKEARDNDALWYFYSPEEQEKNEKEKIQERLEVVKFIEQFSPTKKQQIVKILAFDNELPVDHFIGVDQAVLVFDKACLDMPNVIKKASKIKRLEDYIIVRTLMSTNDIEGATVDGPFYKNPDIYQQRTFLADDMDELTAKIHTFPDLIASYSKYVNMINPGSTQVETTRIMSSKAAEELLSRHAIPQTAEKNVVESEEDEDENEDEDYIDIDAIKVQCQRLNSSQMINLLNNQGIQHNFTEEDKAKDIKDFYYNYLQQ